MLGYKSVEQLKNALELRAGENVSATCLSPAETETVNAAAGERVRNLVHPRGGLNLQSATVAVRAGEGAHRCSLPSCNFEIIPKALDGRRSPGVGGLEFGILNHFVRRHGWANWLVRLICGSGRNRSVKSILIEARGVVTSICFFILFYLI